MCDCCGEHTHDLTLTVKGLDRDEIPKLEDVLYNIEGIVSYDLFPDEKIVNIEYSPDSTDPDAIIELLVDAGFDTTA